MKDLQYVGFWSRFWAMTIDVIILTLVTYPLFNIFYYDVFSIETIKFNTLNVILNYVIPFIITLIFWHYKSATPGKMIFKAKIVDAQTLKKPTTKQFIIRNFAYIISLIPLCLGYFWAGWDKRKQTWHDKLAGTVVVQAKKEKKAKGLGSYVAIGFGIFAIVIFSIIMVLGFRLQSGMMPDGNLYSEKRLPSDVRTVLVQKELIRNDENIRYYQPHSILDFTGSATFFTDTSIRYFDTDEKGEVIVWDFPFHEIGRLSLEIEPFILEIDTLTMTLYDVQGEEEFSVGLSPKRAVSQKIKTEIMELWNNARK